MKLIKIYKKNFIFCSLIVCDMKTKSSVMHICELYFSFFSNALQ